MGQWDDLAAGWERWRTDLDHAYAPVRRWLHAALAPSAGETILELAAGTGSAGFDLAPALAPGGRLISTDASPAMVEVARRRAAELGLEGVVVRVDRLEAVDLPTASMHGVLCESGYMLAPDPALALRETARLLRPGGRLAFSVWGPPERNPWDVLAPPDVLARLGHLPGPASGRRGGFAMADAERTRRLVADAGLADVVLEEVPVRFAFADLDEWERWTIDVDTVGPVLRGLPTAERTRVRREVAAAFEPYAEGSGYALPGVALCVAARR